MEEKNENWNITVDREHYEKLLIIGALWKNTPTEFFEDIIDSSWTQLDEFVKDDLKIEDFRALAEVLIPQ